MQAQTKPDVIKLKKPAYKDMMDDMSINFYTVCDSAEAYFKTIGKDKKGSGYKPFMRWKYLNENKFGISGNRMIDYSLPYKEFVRINEEYKLNQKRNNFNRSTNSNNGWINEGPNQVGTITGHWSPGLGRVEYVKVNPANKNQIYLGSRSSGLYRTNNEGLNWINNTSNLPANGVSCFDANPLNFDEILFNVNSGSNSFSFGIYRSNDGGNTITQSVFNPTNLGTGGIGTTFRIYVIKYHPTIPNLVFISTNLGLFKSTDNLSTYSLVNSSYRITDIEFHSTNPNIIYVYNNVSADRNRILKSTDIGATFTPLADLVGNNDVDINITTVPGNSNEIYLISDNGFWKSVDEGVNINLISTPATGVSFSDGIPKDNNPTIFITGYVDLYKSIDSGLTFTRNTVWNIDAAVHGGGNYSHLQQNYDTTQTYVHADTNYKVCVNGIFYVCTDGFLCKSEDDGVTWQKLTTNINMREYYNLGVNQSNSAVTILGCQDNGTSMKNENGWYEIAGADGMEALSFPLNENNFIFSYQGGGRNRSYNLGYDNHGAVPTLDAGETGYWVAPILYDPNDHYSIYSFYYNVYKSTDFGSTWTKLGAPTTFTGTIQVAAIAENNSNKIVISKQNHLELSVDGGNTFTSILNNLPSNLYISDVTFDPNNDNTIIVTYSNVSSVYGQNKVFISTNSGASWSNITYNLGYMPVHNVIVAFDKIYVGTELGVYYKSLTDTSWTPFNTDLPNVPVSELEVNYGANVIKAATWGRGLFSNKIPGRESFPSIIKTTITSPVTNVSPKTTLPQFVTSNIEYSGVLTNVYVSWSINSFADFNATNVIQMALESGTTWKSISPLPDVPAGSRVYFKVTAVGSNSDISETYKFMYEVKPFEYCVASGNNTTDWYIRRFQLSNLDNNLNSNTTYQYFNTTPIILFKGDTYTLTTQFRYVSSGNTYNVWMDLDGDAEFKESEKIVVDNNITIGFDKTSVKSFTVPSNNPTITTRLRARFSYWPYDNKPCQTNTFGEVEDYLVKIIDKPTITFTGSQNYCVGDNVQLNYTGSTVEAINWELRNGINTYSFSGNTVNTSSLPVGSYVVTIVYTIEGIQLKKDFQNSVKVLPSPSLLDITNVNETICANSIKELSSTGGLVIGNKASDSSGNINLSVPDNSLTTGVSSEFVISNISSNAYISKIDVLLNITHPWLKDLRINLEAPNGKIVNLFNQHGDNGDNLINTIITSNTSAPAFTNVATAAPFTGTYRATLANQTAIATTPAVNSTNFSELFTNPNGIWKLRVYDDGNGDLGTILNCSLILTYDSSEVVWSPVTNLFTDAACTIPYDGLPVSQNVYAKPTETITYSAKAIPESCSNTDTVMFTVGGINKYVSGAWLNGTPPTTGGVLKLEFDDPAGFSSTADLSGCSCEVKQGNVTINSGHTLILDGKVDVTSGNLTIESGAALLQNTEVANTGNVLVKRNSTPMIRLDYTAWGSPVFGQQLQAFSPNTLPNRFYEYLYTGNTTPTAYQSVNAMTNFEIGKGYMIRSPNNWPTSTYTVYNGQFSGVPNNGTISIPVGIGYNLVGNPYPSPINANDLLLNNTSIGTLYFWTHNVPQNGSYLSQSNYASYTTLGGVAAITGGVTPNGKIDIGQGLFVQASSSGNLMFNNTFRRKAAADTQFFRTTENEINRFWLNLTSASLPYNQVLIGYTENSSLAYDEDIDGKAFESDKSMLYTNLSTDKLVIEGRGVFNDADVVSLSVKTIEIGNYTISLGDFEGLFADQNIYLKDNLLNVIHNLKSSSYTFTTTEIENNSRFEIVYQNVLSSDDFDLNNVLIYPNPYRNENSILHINGINENYQFEIRDINGRIIYTAITNLDEIELPRMSSGVYLIKIKTESNIKIEKKLIIH